MVDTYNYELFEQNVVESTWYTVTTVWSALYSGNYDISIQVSYFSGSTINNQIQESIAWNSATAYQGVEFEWDRVHEPYYEERPTDSIKVGYRFLFSNSDFVNFTIRFKSCT